MTEEEAINELVSDGAYKVDVSPLGEAVIIIYRSDSNTLIELKAGFGCGNIMQNTRGFSAGRASLIIRGEEAVPVLKKLQKKESQTGDQHDKQRFIWHVLHRKYR